MAVLFADDAPEIRADLGFAALIDGMAGAALLEELSALRRVGCRQQAADRLHHRGARGLGGPPVSPSGTVIARRGSLGLHQLVGHDMADEQGHAGHQHGADDLVRSRVTTSATPLGA